MLKSFLRLIVLVAPLLSVMSFSCSKKKTIGDPYILFEVHGTVYGKHKVVNPDAQEGDQVQYVDGPVKGIKVSSGNAEAVYTNENGTFIFYGRQAPDDEAVLVFTDEDEATNGGPYHKSSVRVSMRQRDPGDDRNYEGYWFASGLEVNLLLEEDNLDSDSGFDPIG